jgi:pyruvate/2-oxoglutarate dehydrogenase complex dihydrolipoamide acyltransferase (E2) component
MPTKITMPQLGESVAEGTVGHWLKQEGDMVRRDESLVEIITDKVTAELPSPVSGRLVKILVAEDQTVKVGTEIAEIDDGGASSGAPSGGATTAASAGAMAGGSANAQGNGQVDAAANPAPMATGPSGGSPAPAMGAAPSAAPSASAASGALTATASAPAGNGTLYPTGGGNGAAARDRGERVSPLARRLADEYQVDLGAIQGTGEGGRVRKEDILSHVARRADQPAVQAPRLVPGLAVPAQAAPVVRMAVPPAAERPPAPPVTASAEDEIVTPSPMRRMIAEHMVRSKHTSPHATTLVEVDMTGIARWLDHNREDFKRREGYGISFVPFAIKATVEALKQFPYLNASWTEENKIILRKQIHIGVSIALANGLIVPVIRNADALSIAGLARAVSDLAARARSNKLRLDEVQGATFTVNNPGVFGTLLSVAVINQPNAGILTMDAVVKRPVVVDDAIAIRHMMYLGLSFDHRVIDGGTAAPFLVAIKRRLEGMGPEFEVY